MRVKLGIKPGRDITFAARKSYGLSEEENRRCVQISSIATPIGSLKVSTLTAPFILVPWKITMGGLGGH